jgi:hypothetical protein
MNFGMRQVEGTCDLGSELLCPMFTGVWTGVLEKPALAIRMSKPKLGFAAQLFLAFALHARAQFNYRELVHTRSMHLDQRRVELGRP